MIFPNYFPQSKIKLLVLCAAQPTEDSTAAETQRQGVQGKVHQLLGFSQGLGQSYQGNSGREKEMVGVHPAHVGC